MNRSIDFLWNTLRGYSAILFSESRILGAVILVATFFHWEAGVLGLLGILLCNWFAKLLGVHPEKIRNGLYSFNGLLVGLSLSAYHQLNWKLVFLLVIGIVFLLFVTLTLDHLFRYYLALPVLSVPFVVVTTALYLATFNYAGLMPQYAGPPKWDLYFPTIPIWGKLYLKSLGAIFFQNSLWSSLLILIALAFFSRLALILSVLGFACGMAFHSALGGDPNDIANGTAGFNFILTSIALGGIFVVPSITSFVIAGLAACVNSVVISFAKIFLSTFSLPVLALPFTTVTLLFLYGLKLVRSKKLPTVDFLPGSPEENIDYYKTHFQRFGDTGIEIRLPFNGEWIVSQGYEGKYTHNHLWKESLDFMAVDPDGSTRKGEKDDLSDYYTFGLPVLAPADGVVVRSISYLDDNAIGEMNLKNNWGNLVVIQHSPTLFSQISHLQKDSVVVKEGNFVTVGSKIGLAGNSGRSPEPHIHLHFMATPDVGSPTIPMPFTQFLKPNECSQILFNSIPRENDIVSNVSFDFNVKNFFQLAPEKQFSVRMKRDGRILFSEIWTASLDYLGNRFLANEKGDKIYYYIGKDYFACLDYIGSTESALFPFFLATYRVSFHSQTTQWNDKLSYRYFCSWLEKGFWDIALPFTDLAMYHWDAKQEFVNGQSRLTSTVYRSSNPKQIISQTSIDWNGGIPGHITYTNKHGETYELESA